jgi:hypothetical protein
MPAICNPCARAADLQLGRKQDCAAKDGPGSPCPCQHRTDRYATSPNPAFRPAPRTS